MYLLAPTKNTSESNENGDISRKRKPSWPGMMTTLSSGSLGNLGNLRTHFEDLRMIFLFSDFFQASFVVEFLVSAYEFCFDFRSQFRDREKIEKIGEEKDHT